jgi:hypothetical protein
MDARKQAHEYRLLALRLRAEATMGGGAMAERKLETARAFEKIAETIEQILEERNRETQC